MIFACGVRFIRLRSVSVSGCASRSARAARSIASAVIGLGGLGVLPQVVVWLILRCSPSRNNANALLTLGVGYKQHSRTFRHTDDDKTPLTVVFTIVDALDRKRVFEHRLRQIEAHAMRLQVGRGFGVVPFKFQFSLYYGIPVVPPAIHSWPFTPVSVPLG